MRIVLSAALSAILVALVASVGPNERLDPQTVAADQVHCAAFVASSAYESCRTHAAKMRDDRATIAAAMGYAPSEHLR